MKKYKFTKEHIKKLSDSHKGKSVRCKGWKHSEETKRKISLNNTGIKSSQWKGDNIKYQAIHSWLRRKYGKADKCENINCTRKSKQYQWALKSGEKYERKRSNFKKLCRSCHRKQDITQEIKDKISISTGNKVIQLDSNNKIIKTWNSTKQAERELNLHSASVWKVCEGKYKHTNNLYFKWFR